MYKKFYAVRFFFISLLLSMGIANAVTAQTVNLTYEDWSTGGDGTVAYLGNRMHYTITVKNTTSSNISSSTVYAMIPAGTKYEAGTTTVNGVAVSDVNGQMPFRNGGLINSASSAAGVVAPNANVVIDYYTDVSSNNGNFSNTSTLQATNSAGSTVVVNSNTVSTSITVNASCNLIYEAAPIIPSGGGPPTYPYKNILLMDPTTGIYDMIVFSGATGPCYDAISGAALPAGSVLTDAEAIARDILIGSNNHFATRLFFVNGPTNNPAQDLCFIDVAMETPTAYRCTGHPLETNTGPGYNITRMTFGSDGYGYALTANALDLIRFSVDYTTNVPTITPLGALINDAGNGANNVLAEAGGDMFADASGKLYLVPNSGNVYRINPATRIATYIGTISGKPAGGINAVAVDHTGHLIIGGNYQSVYSVDFSTLNAVMVSVGPGGVYKSSDYSSCTIPILNASLNVTKSAVDLITGSTTNFLSGDPIEYTITVTNTGNINAGSVLLYDAIPAYAHYIDSSTTVNGVAIADVNGTMPYAVSGGQLLNSSGAPAGIVKPGDANKLVIKFRVTTDPLKQICNQAIVNFADNDGSQVIYSNDPSTPAGGDATCFYSNSVLLVNKTYRDPITHANNAVISGDPIEYSIEVTNMGSSNATGISLYDAIPAYAHYTLNSTSMNGVPVADNSGLMPFSVTGGQLINSAAQSAGVIVPGDKAVIKFTVTTDPLKQVCNQATVTLTDASGSVINYNSDDPSKSGGYDSTCFYSDGVLCTNCCEGCSTLVNNAAVGRIMTAQVQPNPFRETINLQVQSNTTQQVSVRLIDFYGRTVYTTTQQISAGYNSLHINAPSSLATGVYVLELSAANNRLIQKKLIKQ